MARVVVVHGVGQHFLGRRSVLQPVAAALADGVELADKRSELREADVDVAFYGDVFRRSGTKGLDAADGTSDVVDPYEIALLEAWTAAAAAAEPDRVVLPGGLQGVSKAPTPQGVQRFLNALLRSRCLSSGTAERFLLGALRQVRRYFTEESVRIAATGAVADRIGDDTTVLVGHSLGSVVAYEALCAHPEWPVRALVTLGSPLGMPKLVFERLRPSPVGGRGAWPPGVVMWSNVCDRHDVVASAKRLGRFFDSTHLAVRDVLVDNGWRVHDLLRHLTAAETGEAVVSGLRAAE